MDFIILKVSGCWFRFLEAGRGRGCGGGDISVFPHSVFSALFKTCFVSFLKVRLTAISYPGVRRELLY